MVRAADGERLGRPGVTWLRTPPAAQPNAPHLTAVYGGGGPFGIAYGLGVVDALLEAGVPLRDCEAIGTSAGSWVASCLATGVTFEALREVPPVKVPNTKRGFLRGIAADLFGDAHSERVRASAVRLPLIRRELLSGADHPLADIIAASSAVPWLFAPARVASGTYADGGVRSMVHADRAPAARHLLVVAPIAGPMFGPGGRAMELMLRRELRHWQHTTGGKAHLIRPDTRIAAMARHPLDLFDHARAHEVYPMAYEQAARLAATRPGIAALTQVTAVPA